MSDEKAFQHLYHHLSNEARERLPNSMKTFLRTVEDAPQLISLANGKPPYIAMSDCDPHSTLYPLAQVDYHIPAVSTLGSITSWLDRTAPTQKLSAHNGTGESTIDLAVAMQYGTGLGLSILREQLTQINKLLHSPHQSTRSVILTMGNADAVTKIYRLLGSPGDTFLVEEYSFCGLTNAPIAQGVRWQPVRIDAMGLIPEELEKVLSTWDESRGRRPHVLYCIPTGQNPTGATLPVERRRAIYAIAQKYDLIIIEDDPYNFLQYAENIAPVPNKPNGPASEIVAQFVESTIPSFLSMDVDGRVIRCDTISKTFAPNMRLGWITTNALFCRKLEILTDNSTQHPHGLGQSLLSEILAPTGWGTEGYLLWVWGLRNEYERKRNIFFQTFKNEIGENGHASTKLPIAGMFFWIKIHILDHSRFKIVGSPSEHGPKTNTKELLDELFTKCVNNGVLVMPGALFAMQATDGFVNASSAREEHILDRPYFRMTFVGSDETITQGLKIFGKSLREFFQED
ncbi:L-tyrosine:2-oxoglutarate aminotransferase [Hysterangium stoloniferum]|nr:L-tyrosine:2-oxoglutarate aminotransferase [Hysterangium stoloniferum]